MKYYSYNPITKEYTGCAEARPNPREKGKYLLPAFAAFVKPPETGINEAVLWGGAAWQIIEDYRSKIIYDTVSHEPSVVNCFGVIPGNKTLIKPPSRFHKWNGSEWIVDTGRKQEVIALLKNKINAETDQKIYDGIEYGGVRFYLTAENQQNFSELDRNRAELTYPVTVWCGDNEIQLTDADEVHAFYRYGFLHISVTLEEGKAKKDALQNKTTVELIEML